MKNGRFPLPSESRNNVVGKPFETIKPVESSASVRLTIEGARPEDGPWSPPSLIPHLTDGIYLNFREVGFRLIPQPIGSDIITVVC